MSVEDELRAKIGHLEIALESNRTIATAVGIVMERLHLDRDAAFDKLVTLSQKTGHKIAFIAETIVDTGEIEGESRPPSEGSA